MFPDQSPQSPYVYSSGAASQGGRRKFKPVLLGLIAGLLVIGILGYVFLIPKGSAKSVATEFVQDVRAGNANKSYALTSPSFQLATSLADWTTTVKQISSAYSGQPQFVKEQAITDPNTRQPFTQVTFSQAGSGGPYTLTVQLSNEQGSSKKWQVAVFNSQASP